MTVGDWVCECGQRYRVVFEDGVIRMWPECASGDFREQPIDGECVCGSPVDNAVVVGSLA